MSKHLFHAKLYNLKIYFTILFQIIATDRSPIQPLGVELRILVHILDENDHSPHFSSNEYQIEFSEAASIPTPLIQLQASDLDSGEYGQVTYRKLEGPLQDK